MLSLQFLAIFIFITSILLVLLKRSWGCIPMILVRILEEVLGGLVGWKGQEETFGKRASDKKSFLTVDHLKNKNFENSFEASTELIGLGIQSILQDDLTRPFQIEEEEASLLHFPKETLNLPFYVFGLGFRWGFLFPIRVCFMVFSVLFLTISSVICVVLNAEMKYFRYCGITFAKLFNLSTGLIVNFHDKKNRPRVPGVAVANHLSANDVMTIYSGCDYDGVGYTITGQSHGGFVKYLYKYGGKLTPLLLVDRACDKNRNALLQAIVEHSKKTEKDTYPVLLFPEGYCSNNKAVLQFRKAIFNGETAIYPIAMKQNSRFGDAFWSEDTFIPYLIRIMTSWCSIIDMYYLPAMYKESSESEEQFAKRVQCAIAAKLSVDALPFDGKLKSEKEREKYKGKLQACLAEKL
ncbi:hypothetical protein L5515_017124 [Caenorhabditis briggsae]|uniref:Phospholipid/glycerol acyltransferase domain-containing protein n=2 Tax=Caenorhabditis briggsae TaxID=6238 RepID=A0AAE9FFU5_CAEBR|nr:hypothetical protein L5515_017124 [Caenorhabditis briggsae]